MRVDLPRLQVTLSQDEYPTIEADKTSAMHVKRGRKMTRCSSIEVLLSLHSNRGSAQTRHIKSMSAYQATVTVLAAYSCAKLATLHLNERLLLAITSIFETRPLQTNETTLPVSCLLRTSAYD